MRSDDQPTWDESQGKGLLGKYVLIGLTFTDAEGNVLEQAQRHGIVERAEADAGVEIRLRSPGRAWDGELYRLPPDLRAFSPARPGIYHLRSTGEDVEDPDFTATWEICGPDPGDDTPERQQARSDEARRFGFLTD
jgi:hypothetical protein